MNLFAFTKVKDDGTDAKTFILDENDVLTLFKLMTINKVNTFKIEHILTP